MSFAKKLEELKKFDVNDLDVNNIGVWPTPVKAVVCFIVLGLVLFLGNQFFLEDHRIRLESERAQEQELKTQFSSKVFQAANLEAYKAQMAEMILSFGVMLRQLPSDTEVPGLLEDITRTGLNSGLEFDEIKLQPEVTQQFYIELPMTISAIGGYHDFATFASGVAALPRIVTLHDFEIEPQADNSSRLRMTMTAKTYRYDEKRVAQ
mgnify:CR=1 FL=1